MPITYLEDIDFSQGEDENSCGAHIAYTFDFQGGAASGYNTPLMFKSNGKALVTFDKIEKLKSLGENMDKVEKEFYQQLMTNLNDAVNDKFSDGWDWLCVVDADFDDNVAIFCCDAGLYSVGFQREDLVFTIDDAAAPVVQTTDYQVVDGDLYLSPDFMVNLLDQALASKLKSMLKDASVKKMLIKAATPVDTKPSMESPSVVKTEKSKGDPTLDIQELLKSSEAQEIIKAAVESARAEAKAEADAVAKAAIDAAKAEAEELRKAQIAREIADTEIVVKSYSFIEEGSVSEVVKHLVDNPEVSAVLLKAFDAAKAEIATVRKELGEEKGVSVETKPEKATISQNDAIKKRAAELKAQAAK